MMDHVVRERQVKAAAVHFVLYFLSVRRMYIGVYCLWKACEWIHIQIETNQYHGRHSSVHMADIGGWT